MSVRSFNWTRVLSSNSTSTAFTDKIPTTTALTVSSATNGIWDLLANGWGRNGVVPSYINVMPWGTDGENDTYAFRIWGWTASNDATIVYNPELLIGASVVLGADSSCDGAAFTTNGQLADTITLVHGASDGPFMNIVSSATNVPATVLVHTRGVRWIEFDWDRSGAQEAATMNAHIRPVDSPWEYH